MGGWIAELVPFTCGFVVVPVSDSYNAQRGNPEQAEIDDYEAEL